MKGYVIMESEFNLKLVFLSLRKKLIPICCITLVTALLSLAVTLLIPPTYSSTAKYLSTNYKNGDSFAQSALVSAQQDLVDDYIEIIKSEKMLYPVSEILKQKGLDYSPVKLEKMISGQQIKETSAFTVTVSSKNPEHSRIIIETISENVVGVIDDVQKRENTVAVLDPESTPEQTSPSVLRNVLIAFAVSFIISTLSFALAEFYDRTVRNEDDLKKRFNLPIIGVIPEWKA